jgi:hypothetical protein
MSMFDEFEGSFEPIYATGRSGSSDLISINHVQGKKKEEVVFRVSKEAMRKANLIYRDKVQIQFANDNSICRITKSDKSGAVTLSQQVSGNEMSAGIIRLVYKQGIPNLLQKENEALENATGSITKKVLTKVKYVHEEGKIEYGESQITFKLKLDTSE